jgi:hypothetical protein
LQINYLGGVGSGLETDPQVIQKSATLAKYRLTQASQGYKKQQNTGLFHTLKTG